MAKKELDFVKKPIMQGYLHYAYTFGIFETDYKRFAPFIFNNYIMLGYDSESTNSVDHPYSWELLTEPLYWKQFEKDVFRDWKEDMEQFINGRIDAGWYLWFWLDEFYIPHRAAYKKVHFNHSMLIYGYDDEKKIYDVMGFDEESNYCHTTVSLQDIINSDPIGVSCITPNLELDIKIMPQQIVDSITDFLHPQNIGTRYYQWRIRSVNFIFGIDGERAYCDEFYKQSRGEKEKTFIPCHVIWENKKLMKKRIEYLLENGFMSDETLILKYKPIVDKAFNLKNNYLRFFVGDKRVTPKTLSNDIDELIALEKEILPLVSNDIKKTCKL